MSRPRSNAWLTSDSWVGWRRRDLLAAELLEARQREAEALYQARLARWEFDKLRSRRGVRLALAFSDVRRTGLRRTMAAVGAAFRPVNPDRPPRAPDVVEAPEVLPRVLPLEGHASFDQPQLRVGHLGATARFAGCAPHLNLDEEAWPQIVHDGVDLIVLEPGAGSDETGIMAEIAEAARRRGTPVVLILDDPNCRVAPELKRSCDLVLMESVDSVEGAENEHTLPPTVDTDVFNPIGWRGDAPDPVVVVLTTPQPASEAIDRLRGITQPVRILATADLSPSALPAEMRVERVVDDPRELIRALRRSRVLVDHPAFHSDATSASRVRTASAACGVCVVPLEDAPPYADRPLLIDLASDGPQGAVDQLLEDPDLREAASIETRRAALEHRSHVARFRDLLLLVGISPRPAPMVSVLMASNRPQLLARAVDSYRSQRYGEKELILVLHGDGFADAVPAGGFGDDVTVVRAAATSTLGECLNLGVSSCRGVFIAKMDDDDHYGPEHLRDLVLAQRYSGADLVGKRVTFVHLARSARTIRRPERRSERYTSHVSGPTLLMTARLAAEVGFRHLPRRVDSTFCERVVELGGSIYRTHCRDVVLERHGDAHTWQVADGELEATAADSRPGLDLGWASSVYRSDH